MVRLSDFRPGKPIYPKSETARKSAFDKYRKFYESTYAVDSGGADEPYTYRVAWYKRAAHAYAEFLCSDRARIEVEGVEGPEASAIRMFSDMLFTALYSAAVNMVRFGTGVLAMPYRTPQLVASYSPEQWYPVFDEYYDSQIGDVIVRVVGNEYDKDKKRYVVIDFYIYGQAPYRRVFKRASNNIGQPVSRDMGEGDALGHVFPLPVGYPDGGYGESMYDDIERPIQEMGRVLGLLSQNTARNSDPSLYGPEGAVQINEDGEYVVQDGGQYIPVEPGGIPPNYLQWDSEADAITEGHKLSQELVYLFTGLPRGLFDPSVVSGNSTGSALRRALIPLIARLSSMSAVIKRAIVPMFQRWAEQAGLGPYELADITIIFGYEELIGDAEEGETQDATPTQQTQTTA